MNIESLIKSIYRYNSIEDRADRPLDEDIKVAIAYNLMRAVDILENISEHLSNISAALQFDYEEEEEEGETVADVLLDFGIPSFIAHCEPAEYDELQEFRERMRKAQEREAKRRGKHGHIQI